MLAVNVVVYKILVTAKVAAYFLLLVEFL